MIEIKISTSAALLLLTERMRFELDLRKKAGLIPEGIEFEELNYKTILEIAETAAFDLVFLLPAEILVESNNLDEIICRSIMSLAKYFKKEDFYNYSEEKAKKMLLKITELFERNNKKEVFQYN